ncbi:MAG: transcription antitermination factor NusB [Actinomycetota bacterium]
MAEAAGDDGSRRQARRAAVLLLYQEDLTGHPMADIVARHEADAGRPLPAYAGGLIAAVHARRDALDGEIDDLAEGWSVERIAPVERAVLRVGLVELDADDPPAAVAIAEAVALAGRYASPEAATFVNGILGAAARRRGTGR